MNGLFGPEGDGATELPEELRIDLVPTWISTIGELYRAEAENIVAATLRRRPRIEEILDDLYLRKLHRSMLREVWRWAGQYRTHDTNIGLPWHQVQGSVRDLLDDVRSWIEFGTWEPDETALRFHHRLEWIHPFANGNGRFGRIVVDYLIEALAQPRFTWGANSNLDTPDLRARYLGALRRMDQDPGAVEELLDFARS